jgi:hypothetical protein
MLQIRIDFHFNYYRLHHFIILYLILNFFNLFTNFHLLFKFVRIIDFIIINFNYYYDINLKNVEYKICIFLIVSMKI